LPCSSQDTREEKGSVYKAVTKLNSEHTLVWTQSLILLPVVTELIPVDEYLYADTCEQF